MDTGLESGPVLEKTIELCEVLVGQPTFAALRRDIDAFMGDDEAMRLYREVAEKGQELSFKQQTGAGLTVEDITSFEQQRENLLRNDVARAFLEAQQQLNRVQETVTRYINKTFELGRVPAPEDFGSCSPGCSCGG